MRDRIAAFFRRIASTFGSFTPGQKAVTIVAVVVLAIGGYFFATWAGQPTYAPLFSGLAPADASAIVDKLTAEGTPYKLSDGGGTILVPRDQRRAGEDHQVHRRGHRRDGASRDPAEGRLHRRPAQADGVGARDHRHEAALRRQGPGDRAPG